MAAHILVDFVHHHIGRVAQEQVDWHGQRREQVALKQHHALGQPVTRHITPRHCQCGWRQIDRNDACLRIVHGKPDGNAASASTDVGHAKWLFVASCPLANVLEGQVDQQFGLGAWHQCCGGHFKLKPVELTVASDIGDWLEILAARNQCPKRGLLLGCQRFTPCGQQARAGPTKHVRQQQFGVESRGSTSRGQRQRRTREYLGDGFLLIHTHNYKPRRTRRTRRT